MNGPVPIDPLKPWLNVMVTMANADARERQERRKLDKIILFRSKLLYPYQSRPFMGVEYV